MRRWLGFLGLLLMAVAIGGGVCAAETPATMAPEDLLARLKSPDAPLVLDVRTPEEYAEGHVPGAINVPHRDVEAWLVRTSPAATREIVVYCRSGTRAAIALDTLSRHGQRRAVHLSGDYTGWVAAGRPVEMSEKPKP